MLKKLRIFRNSMLALAALLAMPVALGDGILFYKQGQRGKYNRNGTWLLFARNKRQAGHGVDYVLDIPQGRPDPGEAGHSEWTAAREAAEETALLLDEFREIAVGKKGKKEWCFIGKNGQPFNWHSFMTPDTATYTRFLGALNGVQPIKDHAGSHYFIAPYPGLYHFGLRNEELSADFNRRKRVIRDNLHHGAHAFMEMEGLEWVHCDDLKNILRNHPERVRGKFAAHEAVKRFCH